MFPLYTVARISFLNHLHKQRLQRWLCSFQFQKCDMPISYKAQYIKCGVIAFAKNKLISADLLHIRKSLLKNEHMFWK